MRDPEGKPLSRGSIQKLQIDQRCVGADVSYSRRCKVLPTIRNSLFLFEPRSETASLRMIGEITPQPAFVDQRTSPERLVTPGQDSREPQILGEVLRPNAQALVLANPTKAREETDITWQGLAPHTANSGDHPNTSIALAEPTD